MRVTSNTFAESLKPQLERLAANQIKLQTQIATGQRIQDPSDDPAAMGRVLEIQSEKREVGQYQRNISRLDSLANVSFNSIESLQQLNQRATEVSFRTTDIVGVESYQAYALEVNQLIEQALDIANSKYLDDHLFAGAAVDSVPFTATRDGNGDVTAVAYAGSTTNPQVSISEVAKVTTYNDPTANTQIRDYINNLVALRDAMEAADQTAVRTAATDLIDDDDNMALMLSDLSSNILRLEVAEKHHQQRYVELDGRISEEADADFAESMVNLNKTQNAYRAALSGASRVLQQSLIDFI